MSERTSGDTGESGVDASSDELARALAGSPDVEVRRRSARALGERADDGVYSALSSALRDDDPWVRIEVAEALWKVDRELLVAVPFLVGLQRHDDAAVRARARSLLEQMDVAASRQEDD